MLLRNEAKVGLVVALAIVGLIAVYWFLAGFGARATTYPIYVLFSDARKLDKGADVRLAGVKVGMVHDIALTINSRARVDMLIRNGTAIPVDSRARITSGGFIGDNYIEILPGTSHKDLQAGDKISPAEQMHFDQIMADVGTLLTQLKTSVAGINKIVADKDTIAAIKDTVKSLKVATSSAVLLIASARNMVDHTTSIVDHTGPQVHQMFANLDRATNNAAQAISAVQAMLASDVRPNVKKIMTNLDKAATSLDASMQGAEQLIGSFQQGAGQFNQTMTKLNKAADQTEPIMTNLNQASAGIKEITTDKELQASLKCAMKNAAEATEQARELMTSLNAKYGGGGGHATPKAAAMWLGPKADALWKTSQGQYRFDADYYIGGANYSLYRVGVFDVGNNTKLNLQAGRALGRSAYRYGIYAGKVGVGYDYSPVPALMLGSDLFNPNAPELELRGILNIHNGLGFYAGVDDVLHPGNRNPLVGIQYHK